MSTVKNRQKGNLVLIIIVVACVVILAVLGFLFWNNFVSKNSPLATVSNFEECKNAPGSMMLETFPEQCHTKDGKTFVGAADSSADQPAKQPAAQKSYCADGEQLCFDYPASWTVVKDDQTGIDNPAGYNGDSLSVKDTNSDTVLHLRSGIGGIGGACEDSAQVPVYVLDSTPIMKMTGFKTQNNTDMLHVARVVYSWNDTKTYVAGLYVTADPDYISKQTIDRCGIFLSSIIIGRHAHFDDSANPGAFEFALTGNSTDKRYASVVEAQKAYDTAGYIEAAAILASLHYK